MANKSGKSQPKRKSPKPSSAAKPIAKTAKSKKPVVAKTKSAAFTGDVGRRHLKEEPRKGWHFQRTKHPVKLPNVWQLTKSAAEVLWEHKRLFGGITLIYGLLNLLLVRGLASTTDVGSLKSQFNQIFKGHFGSLASSLGVFATLIGSAGNGNSDTAGAYQLFLAIIVSLAIIWALRQTLAGVTVRLRDAYYRGMYPLIPLMLVLLVVFLELLPMLIGAAIYAALISDNIAITGLEEAISFLIFLVPALLSLYLVSSSLFAAYIVTLPDMTPMKALKSARNLVRHRRWTIARKVLFLPLLLLIVAAIIMVPIIIVLTPLAEWIFFILTMFGVVAAHAYLYTLYRELLND